jgi:hypothetical protein
LDGKTEKLEENIVKRSIWTTFGVTKAQKTPKTRLTLPNRAVIRDFG